MTQTSADIYYDPYDLEIDVDPYPLWKRMRDEAPLYYNERYDFYAVTRFDDVEKVPGRLEDLHLGQGLGPRDDQGQHRDPARAASSSRTRRPTTSTAACSLGCSRRSA